MQTDKIDLPGFIIAELYKSSLVNIEHNEEIKPAELPELNKYKEEKKSNNILFLGDNNKKVIVIVNDPSDKFLNKTDLTFLTNILKACQLNLTDIAIVNTAKQEVLFSKIQDQLHALHILFFNVNPSIIQLPFIIPDFQVQPYAGCTVMVAPALSQLNQQSNEGRLLKTKLWNSLKQIFNIN